MSDHGAHVSITYWPTTSDRPQPSIHSNIVALRLAALSSYQGVQLQFSPGDDQNALRYLRELAGVATDLADQVQRKLEDETVKGLLSS